MTSKLRNEYETGNERPSRLVVEVWLNAALDQIDELTAAMQWFIDRCDRGEVISTRTKAKYEQLIAKVEGQS